LATAVRTVNYSRDPSTTDLEKAAEALLDSHQ
jgi:hypothetical protein